MVEIPFLSLCKPMRAPLQGAFPQPVPALSLWGVPGKGRALSKYAEQLCNSIKIKHL
jgi:hypothetical protein